MHPRSCRGVHMCLQRDRQHRELEASAHPCNSPGSCCCSGATTPDLANQVNAVGDCTLTAWLCGGGAGDSCNHIGSSCIASQVAAFLSQSTGCCRGCWRPVDTARHDMAQHSTAQPPDIRLFACLSNRQAANNAPPNQTHPTPLPPPTRTYFQGARHCQTEAC